MFWVNFKAPGSKDLEIQSRLDLFKGYSSSNNNNNNNDSFKSPPQPPPQPPPPPGRNNFFQPSQTPRQNVFLVQHQEYWQRHQLHHYYLNTYFQARAHSLPTSFTFNNFAPRQDLRGRNKTQSHYRQNLIGQLEQIIEKSEKKWKVWSSYFHKHLF